MSSANHTYQATFLNSPRSRKARTGPDPRFRRRQALRRTAHFRREELVVAAAETAFAAVDAPQTVVVGVSEAVAVLEQQTARDLLPVRPQCPL